MIMRILMINYEFPPLGGGAANACYYMLKEFAKRKDLKIDLVTASDKNKYQRSKFSDNITVHKLKVKKKSLHFWKMSEMLEWSVKAFFYARKLKNKKKYNLCHSWFGWPCGMIAYSLNIPYIVALRGSDVPGYNSRLKLLDKMLFSWISKLVWKKAKAVIANSDGLRKLALKTLRKKIGVIYNGIDTEEFKPSSRKPSNIFMLKPANKINRNL